jgi:PAS domain S-box-containing protein
VSADKAGTPADLARKLQQLGGDIHGPLQEVTVPMYIVDRHGTIVWLNEAAKELVPEAEGRNFTDFLAPELVHPARRRFTLRMLGYEPYVDHRLVFARPREERQEVEISSAPLREGHRVVGVFGVVRPLRPPDRAPPSRVPTATLTPRQHEVLHLLAQGQTTKQMAEHMGLSVETVRNHVRMLLAQLGAKSRLEAVLFAHRRGLLERSEDPFVD